MEVTPDMLLEAREKAEQVLEGLSEDARWALLRERVEAEHQQSREACMRRLELEAIRVLVCPNVEAKAWSALLGNRAGDIGKWFHERRVARAVGVRRDKL